MATVAERLRQLRLDAGVSQETLGKRLGRNQRWVSARERGEVDTTAEEAVEIARALGRDAAMIFLPAGVRLDLTELDPEAIALVAMLVEASPHLSKPERGLVRGMLAAVLDQRRRAVAG